MMPLGSNWYLVALSFVHVHPIICTCVSPALTHFGNIVVEYKITLLYIYSLLDMFRHKPSSSSSSSGGQLLVVCECLLTYSLINALERQCPLSPPDWMADASLIAADLKWDEWVGGCLFYLLVHSFTLFVSGPELKCMSVKCCL